MTPPATKPVANNLEAFFMPFTANRQFKKNPRMLAKAKGVHYWTPEGRKIIDGTAGLWCVNAGHGREEIKVAIARQLDEIARRGISILLVEQKLTIALKISKRLYVMGHGRIVFEGTPAELGADAAIRKEWLEV